jgi:hypothetical protein
MEMNSHEVPANGKKPEKIDAPVDPAASYSGGSPAGILIAGNPCELCYQALL